MGKDFIWFYRIKGVDVIKCLFWNINKKNLVQEIVESSLENEIDVIMLAEADNLDSQYLIGQMARHNRKFIKKDLVPKNKGIMLFTGGNVKANVYKEEKHFSVYKIHEEKRNYLLVVLHLTSAMFKNEFARAQKTNIISRTINKLEESCKDEAQKAGESDYSTIVVGDFNLQPFSDGVIGAYGFNAVMDADIAKKISRTVDGQQVNFYFNPMWHLMGKREGIPGTYYSYSDQEDKSFYWYTYDQVLLRPALIDHFRWEEFGIIKQIGTKDLIRSGKIYKERYSDHLPIKFEVR